MLTSLNRMTGLPVIWRDRQLGYVEQAAADLNRMRLDGLVVRRGIRGARWAGADSILLIGRRSVVLGQLPGRMPKRAIRSVRRAVLTTGGCAGEVSDVIILGDSLRIAALEVTQGPLYRLMGQRAYASDCRVCPDGDCEVAVVPQLLSWAQLRMQLGEGEDA